MSIVRREIEITVRGGEPTEESAVGLIAWHLDIEVLAMRSYCDRDGVVLLLVTTNPTKALHVLESAGFQCEANPVVLIGPLTRSGLAAPIGFELARGGIQVLCSYSSRNESGGRYLVFRTTNEDQAIWVFATSPTIRQMACNESRQNQGTAVYNRLGLRQEAA